MMGLLATLPCILNFLNLLSDDDRVVFLDLFSSIFFVVEGTVMFRSISMSTAKSEATSTRVSEETNLSSAFRTSPRLDFLHW